MPNIGQIVEIDPDQIKAAHAETTSAEVTMEPGNQFGSSSFLWNLPPNSPTRNRATRVPVSIVVRMKSASNMIAKRYQYFITPLRPGTPANIFTVPSE